MKKVEQKVIEFISLYKLIDNGDRLLVSFSGGPDSVFLLHFLKKFSRKYKVSLTAVHFNHGLRGIESDEDEKFVVNFCEENNIAVIVKEIDVKGFAQKNKMSIEEAARSLRYKWLESIRKELKYDKIVTAHNQSDNTETVLLNISTGTGLQGLSGIPIQREKIIRPLLCLNKKEIVDYLDHNGIKYRFDSSNSNSEFKRNFFRNEVIPLIKSNINPSLDNAIFRTSKILESYLPEINNRIKKKSRGLIAFKDGKLSIDLKLFDAAENGILGDTLKSVFRRNFGYEFEFDDFKKMIRLSKQQKGKSQQLGKGLIALKEADSIIVNRKNLLNNQTEVRVRLNSHAELFGKKVGVERADRPKDLFNTEKNIEYVNADKLSSIFILRKWNSGDKFIPLGLKTLKKVSDFLTNEKISSTDKKDQLVLTNRNNIVWVVGLRIDDRYKITSQTKKIYKLWVQ